MADRGGVPLPERAIDVHSHWLPSAMAGPRPPAAAAGLIAEIWHELVDPEAHLAAVERDGIDLRLLSSPLEMLRTLDLPDSSAELSRRSNDLLAEFVVENPGRFAGLATIDAFGGDAAAEEARRAIDELGLAGLFVAAVEGELLLDAPEALPTFEFAAERGVPVLIHPVNPPVLPPRYAAVPAGHALGRASESAISILALLRSGLLSRLPDLRVVTIQLSSVSLLLAHYLDPTGDVDPDAWKPSDDRSRLYVDVAGFEPIAVRAALAAVGVERLLIGTDHPVYGETPLEMIVGALLDGGVPEAELDRVAAGTAAELFAVADRRGVEPV